MKKFLLRGIAEGVTGVSFIYARDINDVFVQRPELVSVKEKLLIADGYIGGYSACDG